MKYILTSESFFKKIGDWTDRQIKKVYQTANKLDNNIENSFSDKNTSEIKRREDESDISHFQRKLKLWKYVDILLSEDSKWNKNLLQNYYSCDKDDSNKFEFHRECEMFGSAFSLDIRILDWIDEHPGKFLVYNIRNYNLEFSNFKLIKFSILIKDILEVCNHKLDIISIRIRRYNPDSKFEIILFLREIGHEEGDDMPLDIYNYYIEMIRYKLKKKADK
jgi:hypothetical protein